MWCFLRIQGCCETLNGVPLSFLLGKFCDSLINWQGATWQGILLYQTHRGDSPYPVCLTPWAACPFWYLFLCQRKELSSERLILYPSYHGWKASNSGLLTPEPCLPTTPCCHILFCWDGERQWGSPGLDERIGYISDSKCVRAMSKLLGCPQVSCRLPIQPGDGTFPSERKPVQF